MTPKNNPSPIQVFSDGGSRGNPGPAAIGYVISKDQQELGSGSHYIGTATNNVAEYQALLQATKHLLTLNLSSSSSVTFHLDSQLVVNQLNGVYKLKSKHLKPLLVEIKQLLRQLSLKYQIVYIPREQNSQADLLVNQALDAHLL